MSFRMQHDDMQKKVQNVRLESFWAFWKVQNKAIPTVPPEGQTEKWKALKPRVKAENMPKWAQRSQGSIWDSGRVVGDGARKRVMECEMCTEMVRWGGAGKGSASKGWRGAEHGQTCPMDRTGAVALRAALESAVPRGPGNEVNRQAEMANPSKCRIRGHLQTDLARTCCNIHHNYYHRKYRDY
jgi:hypothetical protein